MPDEVERQRRQVETTRRRAAQVLPEPPYHVSDVEMLYLMARFDPDWIRSVIPPPLTPTSSGWGTIAFYRAGHGWDGAPYSAFFTALEIEGIDSPDGVPGQYGHSGAVSGIEGEVMRTAYNSNLRIGWSRLSHEGDRVVGEAGVGDKPLIRLAARVTGQEDFLTGISRYAGRRQDAGFNAFSVAFSGRFQTVTPLSLEYSDAAPDAFRCGQPLDYVWPMWATNLNLTYSHPRRLGSEDAAASADLLGVGLVDLFARMGRAAAIVDGDGGVLRLNAAAEELVSAGTIVNSRGRLRPPRHADAAAFESLLSRISHGVGVVISDRIAFPVPATGRTIIAQAVVVDPSVAGPGKLLVFFDDPGRQSERDPVPALRLLGLTPAEARIASLVGAGRSPKEVADRLELSLNTVRSSLKLVFAKLGISRQSELAKIVARLEIQAV